MKRLMVLSFVVTLALSACTSGSDPKPDPKATSIKLPEPGQCLAKETNDLDLVAPDFSSVVSCKKSHVYEIIDVLNVPDKFLVTGSREKRLEHRSELVKSTATGSLAKDFHDYADYSCVGSVLLVTGLDGARIGDKWPVDADVHPELIGATTLTSVSPPDQWAAGKPRIICSFRYTVPANPGDPRSRAFPVQSPSGLPTYRDFLTSDYPAERRACGSYDDDNYLHPLLCINQHNVEVLFSYDASLAFGKKFADSVDGLNPSDAHWDKLVEPCTEALWRVFGPSNIDDDLASSVYLGDDWSTRHKAFCLVTPESDDLDLPSGSIVGHAWEVSEVPRKKLTRPLSEYPRGI